MKNQKGKEKIFRNVCFVLLAANIIFGGGNTIKAQTGIKSDAIKPFINFLENNQFPSAKEYILSKFETYDIVVFSERNHSDMTQYEVILDVVKDERFKGHIYTEVGVANMSERLNSFLRNSTFTKEEKERELLNIYRDLDYYFIWEPYNYFHLISEVYEINKNRKNEEKILIFPTDIAFDWNSCKTHREWDFFIDSIENRMNRDSIMGVNFVNFYETAKKENPDRKNALVIMNSFHGYTRIPTSSLPSPTDTEIYSTGEYIYRTYPDETFNIHINYCKNHNQELSNNGIFEAAMEYAKKDNIGFDLKNTPVGNLKFDLYLFGDYASVNFDYIFDGMIFYKPLKDIVLKSNIPDIFPEEYEEEFFRRAAIVRNQTLSKAMNNRMNKRELKTINIPVERPLDKKILRKIDKQIKRWIE